MKVRALALSLLLLVALIVCFQIPIAVNATILPTPPPPATLLWYDPVNTLDIALSKDGQYVAIAAQVLSPSPHGEVRFYSRSSGTPIWTYSAGEGFLSVAISADGDCVAAGNGSHVCFWKNARSLPGAPDPTWSSIWLGPIEYRSLDISDDGNYLVASGTGDSVYYWANAKGLSGNGKPTTWEYHFGYDFSRVHAVDLSSSGDYVVAGTNYDVGLAYAAVAYWKNAKLLTGDSLPNWNSTEPNSDVVDVAVSDDGNYVAAASGGIGTVYYWAGAKGRSGNVNPSTWHSDPQVSFSSVDMSSDGDRVVAGGYNITSGEPGVYFWAGARGLSGKPQNPTWVYDTANYVEEVAIDAAGDYMAAANDFATPYVYFLDNSGNLKWQYGPLEHPAQVLSISSAGGTLAIGSGSVITSGYLLDTGYRTPTEPVGGLTVPPDKLALLSPWIAVALAALALTVFATKRRRKR